MQIHVDTQPVSTPFRHRIPAPGTPRSGARGMGASGFSWAGRRCHRAVAHRTIRATINIIGLPKDIYKEFSTGQKIIPI